YDAVGRVASIPGIVNAVQYSADGQVLRQENANGTVTTRSYDPAMGWLTSERTVSGTAVVQDRSYARNADGQLASVTSPFAGESWDYTYDARHRLASATHVGAPADDQAFVYDTLGRLTFNSQLGQYTYG
ncbi:MAG: RHS repeat protein, partial [Actinobacteria bacterium]|nr:RHS repeat protein [Actinomycetota bacterium]NIS33624.1 RHS repeat protein [Actinomycetota bacterium]NIU68483.1 RHS repeat protein [Actinomycetota bacterium]NIW30308.1 hypothetical protein [Actinomycetota bacterium]